MPSGREGFYAYIYPVLGGSGGGGAFPPATPPAETPGFAPLVRGPVARADAGLAARLLARITGAR